MPKPKMKHPIKIYDDGGRSFDRYTIVLLNQKEKAPKMFCALAANETPFAPNGFGQHTSAQCGRHLGKRIKFYDLPVDVQKFVVNNLDPHEYRALMFFEHIKPKHDKAFYREAGKKLGLQYAGFWDGVLHYTQGDTMKIIDCYEEALENGDLEYFAKNGLTLAPID